MVSEAQIARKKVMEDLFQKTQAPTDPRTVRCTKDGVEIVDPSELTEEDNYHLVGATEGVESPVRDSPVKDTVSEKKVEIVPIKAEETQPKMVPITVEEDDDSSDSDSGPITFATVSAKKTAANEAVQSNDHAKAVELLTSAIFDVEGEEGFRPMEGVTVEFRSILYSNRALCHLALQKWEAAKNDCARAEMFNEKNIKARFRRAVACKHLGEFGQALKDVNAVLEHYEGDDGPAEELKEEIVAGLQAEQKRRKEAVLAKTSSPPKGPNVPAIAPRSAYELECALHALRKHPEAVKEYVSKRLGAKLITSFFAKNAIEPDVLGMIVSAVESLVAEEAMDVAAGQDYVSRLVKTRMPRTQFMMLSDAEQSGTFLKPSIHLTTPKA